MTDTPTEDEEMRDFARALFARNTDNTNPANKENNS